MIDHDAAVRFDSALDQLVRGERIPEDGLIDSARTVQQLDAEQRGVPSADFRAQLRAQFAGDSSANHLNGHHPVAERPIPAPLPKRPAQPRPSHRWLAFAAALLLLLAGGGAIVLEGLGLRDDSEPSAIPAVSFASPDAEAHATGSPGATNTAMALTPQVPMALSDGILYRIERDMGDVKFTGLRAYRAKDSKRLWEIASSDFGNLLVAAGNTVFTTLKPNGSDAGQIVAHDAGTGNVVWSTSSGGTVTGLAESDGVLYAVDSTGSVAAVDVETGALRWSSQVDGEAEAPLSTFGSPVGVALDYVSVLTSAGTVAVLHRTDGAIAWTRDGYDPAATGFALTDNGIVIFDRRERVIDPAQPVATPDAFAVVMTPVGGQPTNDPEATMPTEPWVDVSWEVIGYDLASGGFYWSGGGQVVNAPPASLNGVVAYSGTTYDRGPSDRGLVDGIFGLTPRQPGTVILDLPAQHKDEIWTQLGAWTPPDGSPPVFVAVSNDGLLTLISPRRLGPVEGLSSENDPYDGAFVELGQPVVSQPIGDESGIWVTLADGTLASIHPQRLLHSATPGPLTVEQDDDGIAWSVDGSEGVSSGPVAADGRVFWVTGTGIGWNHLQGIDADDGAILWDRAVPVAVSVMQTYGDWLLVAGQDGESLGFDYLLVAYDAQTGAEVWRTSLSQLPAGMAIRGNRAYLLGNDNHLDAIDLSTRVSLYVSDLRGASKPLDAIPNHAFTTYHRLVFAGDNLVAVLADGSIAGVDPETGSVRWSRRSDVSRTAQVYELSGHVVIVEGNPWASLQQSQADLEATPVASPVPGSTNCLDLFGSAEPDGTATGLPKSAWVQSFFSVDTGTGDLLWSAGTMLDYRALPYADGLVMVANVPPADRPEIRADMAVCGVSAENGTISPIDDLRALTDTAFRWNSAQDELVTGLLADGNYLTLPQDLAPEWPGPDVDLNVDPEQPGIGRADMIDGAIYLSLWDGRLMKLKGI